MTLIGPILLSVDDLIKLLSIFKKHSDKVTVEGRDIETVELDDHIKIILRGDDG